MNKYLVATIHPWNIEQFNKYSATIEGDWQLITERTELTVSKVKAFNPDFIFFPHWSWKVPKVIFQQYTCVCFHMTDLPFGRGGSPLQNLIMRGFTQTKVSALKMCEDIDAGPIYTKEPLSLDGSAEDIFKRAATIVSKLIKTICTECPTPKVQQGDFTLFHRRTPEQSEIPDNISAQQLYDFIRMLDAPNYPKAFTLNGNIRIDFSDAQLVNNEVTAKANFSVNSFATQPPLKNALLIGHKND
jgi:methionyl-tRNA formyltransferase